jgi:hypothetical protein
MPSFPKFTLPPLDLLHSGEHTRRRLYDHLQELYFVKRINSDPELSEEPLYSAQDAQLTVFFGYGRWFVVWDKLEVPSHQPECERIEMLRIKAAPGSPMGISLSEC